ncbi:hypothetical protein J40TS1_35030 [Paenibacillus montaniterrae]|uniref:Uncharacterized protein n=1 Tax=Paenibacillus montaniterrae TaxID=429341 RepID=A0A919YV66_9BACL|nr:hypothetical protein [Paenibacillus montaniterrae]GIP17861.1 hypothetical protein J40TS1_35030 [Paenibacillus montaniterrae]
MKKIIVLVLLVGLFSSAYPVQANSFKLEDIEIRKQEKIDKVFTEMNRIVNTQNHMKYLNSLGINTQMKSSSYANEVTNILQLEQQLSNLGVRKIDPNNQSDMLLLKELFADQEKGTISTNNSTAKIPDPPNLSAIASIYTLYHYKGTYTVDNTTYDYAYIRVVDNKGYNKLYIRNEFDAAPRNATQSVIRAVLSHTFKYSFSSLLSKKPIGVAIDWTMGAVIAGLGAYNSSNIYSGNEPLYRIYSSSTSSLTYYYIYHNNSWKLMGTGGEFNYSRGGIAQFNYNGQAKTEYATLQEWTSSTDGVWYDYVTSFHNNRHISNYHRIESFGSLKITGYNGAQFTHTPVFVNLPGYLI